MVWALGFFYNDICDVAVCLLNSSSADRIQENICLCAYGYQPQERCPAVTCLENFHHWKAACMCLSERDRQRGEKGCRCEMAFKCLNIVSILMGFDPWPFSTADWPRWWCSEWPFWRMTCFLLNIAFVSHYYALIFKVLHPHLSITVCSFHCSIPLSHTQILLCALLALSVSGQKWKDYCGKGVPLSLEIGQILCACSYLWLLRGPGTEQ